VPFRHPDRSADLSTRIEFEVRERLEEALDYVCLDALVRDRKARGLPPPAADNPADRRAYGDNVLALLDRLSRELAAEVSPEDRRRTRAVETTADEQARGIAIQVALARRLPDYWQRFDAISTRFLAEISSTREGERDGAAPDDASGGESRSLFGRLFGRG
jgi:hypothetical protein